MGRQRVEVEHPTGSFLVEVDVRTGAHGITTQRTALLRTARKLMEGTVFVPADYPER